MIDPNVLKPLVRTQGRRTAVEVHDALRQAIQHGRFKPGEILSQVEVARALQVSRTPVREAMRMLQESGLISAEPNLRSRILGFDPQDIESLYAKRIILEAFGVSLTAQRMEPQDIERFRDLIAAMEGGDSHDSFAIWQDLHRQLHRLIVAKAGDPFVADLSALEQRSERYQSAYRGEHPAAWWQRGEAEHRAIFEAMAARDAPLAAELTARHLARTALELLAAHAPEHDTSMLRCSLQFAIAAAKRC